MMFSEIRDIYINISYLVSLKRGYRCLTKTSKQQGESNE